jgi:hypothetical protein
MRPVSARFFVGKSTRFKNLKKRLHFSAKCAILHLLAKKETERAQHHSNYKTIS